MKLVCSGERPLRLNEPRICDRAWDLIQWCWERDASRRPAIEDVTKFMVDTDCHISQRDTEGVGLAVVIAFIVIMRK